MFWLCCSRSLSLLKGLKIKQFLGNFYLRGKDLLSHPNIDSDKAIALEYAHKEGVLPAGGVVTVQAALL